MTRSYNMEFNILLGDANPPEDNFIEKFRIHMMKIKKNN